MGLLNKLSESGLVKEEKKPAVLDKPIVKKSNSVGLLKKSLNMTNSSNRLDFFNFIKKYNLQICAVFNSQNDVYCVEHSCGLDGESICLSVSTRDFWDGISQDDQDTLPFYQFFSAKIKDKISNLNFFKADNGNIFLFQSDKEILNSIYTDIENLSFEFEKSDGYNFSVNNYQFFTVDYSEAVESLVLSLTKSNEKERLINSIISLIHFNLLKNFSYPSYINYKENGKFDIAFYCDTELPFEVFANHLMLESEVVLGKHAELISIEQCTDFFGEE